MTEKKVYLVGAGPGDPGLLTIKARNVLSAADCVLYDYLVSAEVMWFVRPEAEKIYVGKQGGQIGQGLCITQDELNRVLIEKAREHPVVVRLKGGDPFIFGRGGEEALALAEAEIAFEVIPGVSSGVAAPAYAGIPLTYRGVSSSVAFVTAHEDPHTSRWERAAANADTLVFFMGVARIQQLVDELYAQGREPKTPVAVIRWGTTTKQEVYVSDLENIAALMSSHDVQPPALVVVGEVVKLRESLQWFGGQ
jgi:uroporphyrinogen III methyltransferase/synthase